MPFYGAACNIILRGRFLLLQFDEYHWVFKVHGTVINKPWNAGTMHLLIETRNVWFETGEGVIGCVLQVSCILLSLSPLLLCFSFWCNIRQPKDRNVQNNNNKKKNTGYCWRDCEYFVLFAVNCFNEPEEKFFFFGWQIGFQSRKLSQQNNERRKERKGEKKRKFEVVDWSPRRALVMREARSALTQELEVILGSFLGLGDC